MKKPQVKRAIIGTDEYVVCSEPNAYVTEYVFWAAGGPLKTAQGLRAAQEFLPNLRNGNFGTDIARLVTAGRLVKLGHGWYVHADVARMLE